MEQAESTLLKTTPCPLTLPDGCSLLNAPVERSNDQGGGIEIRGAFRTVWTTEVLRWLRKSLIPYRRVWHIGTLRREAKGWDSYEGDGLSVSLDPDAWRVIARLSGPLYRLEKEQAAFLDAYRCLSLLPLMRSVWKWALREQYVERRRVYRVDWYDLEKEDWRRFSFLSQQEAREEYLSLRLATPHGARYNTFLGYVPTEKMRVRAHHRMLPLAFVRDFALSFYVEDHLPEIDGLWWEEENDPMGLSAPRGVIFTHQLGSWQCEVHSSPFS